MAELLAGLLNPFLKSNPVVIVANPELPEGTIITPLRNSDDTPKVDGSGNELGTMRLEQVVSKMNGGFLNRSKRTAFITAPLDQLTALVAENKLKAGSIIPGKIIQNESLQPMWNGQEPKVNPTTAERVTIQYGNNEYPVYMQQRYTDDMNAKDNLVRTTDDVQAFLALTTEKNEEVTV